jgi:hypothetical protein
MGALTVYVICGQRHPSAFQRNSGHIRDASSWSEGSGTRACWGSGPALSPWAAACTGIEREGSLMAVVDGVECGRRCRPPYPCEYFPFLLSLLVPRMRAASAIRLALALTWHCEVGMCNKQASQPVSSSRASCTPSTLYFFALPLCSLSVLPLACC